MFINKKTNEIITGNDLRKRFKNTSFPKDLTPDSISETGFALLVKDYEIPEHDYMTHIADHDGFKELAPNVFTKTFKVRERTHEEKLDVIRQERARSYPAVHDQLDEVMKWLATENEFKIPKKLKSMAAKCMAVKSKFPKPEEQ